MGLVLLGLGDTEGATREFERAIELKPDLADACNNLGMALHRRGERGRAGRVPARPRGEAGFCRGA